MFLSACIYSCRCTASTGGHQSWWAGSDIHDCRARCRVTQCRVCTCHAVSWLSCSVPALLTSIMVFTPCSFSFPFVSKFVKFVCNELRWKKKLASQSLLHPANLISVWYCPRVDWVLGQWQVGSAAATWSGCVQNRWAKLYPDIVEEITFDLFCRVRKSYRRCCYSFNHRSLLSAEKHASLPQLRVLRLWKWTGIQMNMNLELIIEKVPWYCLCTNQHRFSCETHTLFVNSWVTLHKHKDHTAWMIYDSSGDRPETLCAANFPRLRERQVAASAGFWLTLSLFILFSCSADAKPWWSCCWKLSVRDGHGHFYKLSNCVIHWVKSEEEII